MTLAYPSTAAGRDRFIRDRRGPRAALDPFRHQGWVIDAEPVPDGAPVDVATIFLTGRECPWTCAMCDLWQHTTTDDTLPGAIPAQVAQAIGELRAQPAFPPHVKLYNAGSFFDPRAVPVGDYAAIAARLSAFSHVIVESHPSLVGPRVDGWQDLLSPTTLEVAMGLETVHPGALEQLNKRMTLASFQRAAAALGDRGVSLRVFLLVHPPFIAASEQDDWLARSVDAAFDCGASVVSLIPTRAGNGALDALAANGAFQEPKLDDLERGFSQALRNARGRVFADLWDLRRFARCPHCADARRARLAHMNLTQQPAPPVACALCDGSA